MRSLFIISIFLVFISDAKTCNEKISKIPVNECNAMILGDTVKIYEEPGKSLNRIEFYNIHTIAKIIEKTSQRIVLDSVVSICDKYGYFWYNIETPDGLTGWVYGKDIFEFSKNTESTPHYMLVGKQFSLNNKYFYFGIADDVSYPAVDSKGITGCENFSFPFFFTPDDAGIYPLKFDLDISNENEKMTSLSETDWLLLESSSNVIDNIEEIEVVNNEIFIVIKRQFPDEIVKLNFVAELKNNYIEIVSKRQTLD